MGCARFICNAKCDEDRYLTNYARKYMPVGTYAPIDQKFSQYKNNIISPWLSDCPSQILRNSAVNWYQTYQKFLKGLCGKPRRKKKSDGGSIHLTKELFKFEICKEGVTRLSIGSKTNNIACLSIKNHASYQTPKSIYIKKRHEEYWVSFCYEDSLDESNLCTQKETLKYLKNSDRKFLETHIIGIDRGIVRPVQVGDSLFDLSPEQKKKKRGREKYLKRCQRRLAKQKKGSKHRYKTKKKSAYIHQKVANIRKDFCHKTSRKIVSDPQTKIIILEDLRTKNMTYKPKAKHNAAGKWERNGSRAKAGLNRSILDKGWHHLEAFIKYKSYRAGKAWFKVPAHHTLSGVCRLQPHSSERSQKPR